MACRCPKCGQGKIYQSFFDLTVQDNCSVCGLEIGKNDSADGPAFFLIFILGFLLVPAALLFDSIFSPPLWVHAMLWGIVAIVLCVGTLKPLKSYIIYLQYKHRKSDWE